jgi:Tat protein secretion system quality control protein TatD with DNase activity
VHQIAAAGYTLSIPSAVARVESFQKLVKELPMEAILTETDSPYQGPEKVGGWGWRSRLDSRWVRQLLAWRVSVEALADWIQFRC